MTRKILTVALAMGALSAPFAATAVPRYHVVARPSPAGFVAQAVNAHGVVAGYYADPSGSGPYTAALIRKGVMSIEPDVGFNTLGTAVTPKGDMLGEVVDGGHCNGSPVVWPKDGQPMERLPVGCGGVPLAAHSATLAVGFEYSPTDPIMCAYWKDGTEVRVWPQWGGDGECALRAIDSSGRFFAGYASYSYEPLEQHILLYTIANGAHDMGGVPGYPLAHANAVNVHGHTAGVASADPYFYATAAFFHDGSKVTVLSPPSQYAVATAIDDRDEVVGYATDTAPPYATHGMLWSQGQSYDLATLMDHPEGWSDLRPGAIAADGTIAGVGTKDGATTLFVLKPIHR
jgi:hypothetical protein